MSQQLDHEQASLRRVGFFAELRHGSPNAPSLRESVGTFVGPVELVVGYLSRGAVVAVSGRLAIDVLAADDRPIGQLSVMSDGEWVWPSDLPYYVERYGVGVPAELVERARVTDGVPPVFGEDQLRALAARVRAAKQ